MHQIRNCFEIIVYNFTSELKTLHFFSQDLTI